MGKKYIIELEDKPFLNCDNSSEVWRVKGFNALFFDQNGIERLTPYDEYNVCNTKKELINVGDVLIINDIACVVLDIDDDVIVVITENGCVEHYLSDANYTIKSGFHYDIKRMVNEIRRIHDND